MSRFDLRILITPLVSSNSSQNNHIMHTLVVLQSLFSMRINMCSSWWEGVNVEWMVGGGLFLKCNEQSSQFR